MSEHDGSTDEHNGSADEQGANIPLLATQVNTTCSVCRMLHRSCPEKCIYAKDFPRDQPFKLELLLQANFTIKDLGNKIRKLDENGRTIAVNKLLNEAHAKLLKEAKAREQYPQEFNTQEAVRTNALNSVLKEVSQVLSKQPSGSIKPQGSSLQSLANKGKRARGGWEGTSAAGSSKSLLRDLTDEPPQFTIPECVQKSPRENRTNALNSVLKEVSEVLSKQASGSIKSQGSSLQSLANKGKRARGGWEGTSAAGSSKSLSRDLTDEPPQFTIPECVQKSPRENRTNALNSVLKEVSQVLSKQASGSIKPQGSSLQSLANKGKRARGGWEGTSAAGSSKSLLRGTPPLLTVDDEIPVDIRTWLLYALRKGFGAVKTDMSDISEKVQFWESIIDLLWDFDLRSSTFEDDVNA